MYNTTPNWTDPNNPPPAGSPYYSEWLAANPQVPGGDLTPIYDAGPGGGTLAPGPYQPGAGTDVIRHEKPPSTPGEFVKGQKYPLATIPGIKQYDPGVFTDGTHFFDADGVYAGDDPKVFNIGGTAGGGNNDPTPPPSAPPTPPPSAPGTVNQIVNTIPQSFYTKPTEFQYPDYVSTFEEPSWSAPDKFNYPQYVLPTGEEVLAQDPGYDFRKSEGSRAITNNASMSGLLRSTQTAKALENYGSSLASQEYGAAVGRGTGVWGMNRAAAAEDYDRLWRNMLTDYGVRYGAAQDTETRHRAEYDTNFKNAATKQGFALDSAAGEAGGKQGATSLAGNLTLGAGNLALNEKNSTFANVMDLYRLSTANLPTYQAPPTSTFT